MLISVSSQAVVFLYTVIGGMLAGFVYDLFRVSRKIVKTNNLVVFLEDIFFWLIISILIFGVLFFSNAGEIRGYAIIGIILGVIIYALLFSHYVVSLLLKTIDIAVKCMKRIYKIISFPIKYIIKILYYPISYIYDIIYKTFKGVGKIKNKIIGRLKLNIKNVKTSIKKF